jgi:hypothetical protein
MPLLRELIDEQHDVELFGEAAGVHYQALATRRMAAAGPPRCVVRQTLIADSTLGQPVPRYRRRELPWTSTPR